MVVTGGGGVGGISASLVAATSGGVADGVGAGGFGAGAGFGSGAGGTTAGEGGVVGSSAMV
jgi:hypothetical protein